jgi:hypothetical protein
MKIWILFGRPTQVVVVPMLGPHQAKIKPGIQAYTNSPKHIIQEPAAAAAQISIKLTHACDHFKQI